MSSYRDGKPTGLTKSRLAGSVLLGGVKAAAQFSQRHSDSIRRYCIPVACDVGTRAELYELDHCVRQFKAMDETRCCIQIGNDDPCGSSVMRNAPLPICAYHAATITAFFEKQDLAEVIRATALARQKSGKGPRGPLNAPRSAVVYYIQVGATVKIGTTIDVKKRLADYPPGARLLATEPGGFALERERLAEFNEYLTGGKEWFAPGPRLREHIEKLMAAAVVAA